MNQHSNTHSLTPIALALFSVLGFVMPPAFAQQNPPQNLSIKPAAALPQTRMQNIAALEDKGRYWFERFRFDLARQQFNRVLLIDPKSASAMRWLGLIDVANSEVQSAQIWLDRLTSLFGPRHPMTQELRQSLELSGAKRQKFAELKYLANSDRIPFNLHQQITRLFPEDPLGDVAVQLYKLMTSTDAGAQYARFKVEQLVKLYPDDARYKTLLADILPRLPQAPRNVQTTANTTRNKTNRTPTVVATGPRAVIAPETQTDAKAESQALVDEPFVSNFDRGSKLAEKAQAAISQNQLPDAYALYQEAIGLNPNYAWFRYDLARLYSQNNEPEKAIALMDEGLKIERSTEIMFAKALLLAQQNREQDALNWLNQVPLVEWTEGMHAMKDRIDYAGYLTSLQSLETKGKFNALAQTLKQPNRWHQNPDIVAMQNRLTARKRSTVQVGFEDAVIDGTPGVSRIESKEVPIQINLPVDFEKNLFLRMDTLRINAGSVNPIESTNFGRLGTLSNAQLQNPSQAFQGVNTQTQGYVLGLGLEQGPWRFDLGKPVGNFPEASWVGGIQWRSSTPTGTLRLELARRMVSGSVLATVGATDPVTGQSWGGIRRNGINAVWYQPINNSLDWVSIGRLNLITGSNVPNNREINLQNILSQTLWQNKTQRLELSASLFLWSFQKNLRFYTFGQGGYYSPQSFASLSLPLTWRGQVDKLAWRLQASIGRSRSREDDANLYPLDTSLASLATAQGNPSIDPGGRGGGSSRGLRAQVEYRLLPTLALGGQLELDRSEGYNPDKAQLYLKYAWEGVLEDESPVGLSPYSKF